MIDLAELKKRIEFHLDDRDACEYTGNILPDSLEAIEELQSKVYALQVKLDLVWADNVRRREAIEKHRQAMRDEKIASYYFDRELWAVLREEQ